MERSTSGSEATYQRDLNKSAATELSLNSNKSPMESPNALS